jgi:hypothetical protein
MNAPIADTAPIGVPSMKSITALSLGTFVSLAMGSTALAGPAVFTWNPGAASPALSGAPFTGDQLTTTDFLFNRADAAGIAYDDFILRIDSVSRNGSPVAAGGLGSSYGLYLFGHVTLHAGPGGVSIYDSGTVSLMADPTNNDGAPSATWNAGTQTGGVSFANPANIADDITLASGALLSGSFGVQSNGLPGVKFVNDFRPALAETGFFPSPLGALVLTQALFNTSTSRVAGTTLDGGSFITVNNGFGAVTLDVPEPMTLSLFGIGLAGLFAARGRRSG